MSVINANVLRSVRRVELTQIEVLRGSGVDEDPYRTVVMLFNDAGECVAEHDSCYPTPWYAPLGTCDDARPAR